MRKAVYIFFALAIFISMHAQDIKLIIRADDMGSFHAANEACIDGHQKGIIQSIEVMPCCSWFPEAVSYLKTRDTLVDVGIHLMLTSEWINVKWQPLTKTKSLIDENGYFYPFITPRIGLEAGYPCLISQSWNVDEVEKEFRAQIEFVKKNIPRVSHISTHMGCNRLSEAVIQMTERLAKEYGLYVKMDDVKHLQTNIQINDSMEIWIDKFIKAIDSLTHGTYMFVEHPAYNTTEMETVGHIGYMNVAEHREKVIKLFTSEKVKQALRQKGVELISYADLK